MSPSSVGTMSPNSGIKLFEPKILITGGNGQLGQALREFYPNAIYTDKAELDLSDPDLAKKVSIIDPDRIINCGAIVGQVDAVEDDPLLSIEVNSAAVSKMLSAMRDPSGFIQISSDYVNSDNVYGLTKRLSEAFVRRNGGLIIRTSWIFGDGKNWVNWTLENAYKPLKIVNDQIARPTYARDLARAIKQNDHRRGTLCIQNSGRPVSWYEYAKKVCQIKDIYCAFEPISTEDYMREHPEVAPRPMDSVFEDFPGMPKWQTSLKEYINASS